MEASSIEALPDDVLLKVLPPEQCWVAYELVCHRWRSLVSASRTRLSVQLRGDVNAATDSMLLTAALLAAGSARSLARGRA